jgi:hypothetical protein
MNAEIIGGLATVEPFACLRLLLAPEASNDGIGNAVCDGRKQTIEDSVDPANGLQLRLASTHRSRAVCDSHGLGELALRKILPAGGVG